MLESGRSSKQMTFRKRVAWGSWGWGPRDCPRGRSRQSACPAHQQALAAGGSGFGGW